MEASGGYQANHVAPVIKTLLVGLATLPAAAVDVTVLAQGPFPDTQPRDHEHVQLRFKVGLTDLSEQSQAIIKANLASSDSNRDLYGDALDHGSPLYVGRCPVSVCGGGGGAVLHVMIEYRHASSFASSRCNAIADIYMRCTMWGLCTS